MSHTDVLEFSTTPDKKLIFYPIELNLLQSLFPSNKCDKELINGQKDSSINGFVSTSLVFTPTKD